VFTGWAVALGSVLGWEVAVPQGWHARVELAGLAKERAGPLVVAVSMGGLGVADQLPGVDLLPVLLPQLGTGRVQPGRLIGQVPGLVQVPGPVRLVGCHRSTVSLHPGVVALAGRCLGRAGFGLRRDWALAGGVQMGRCASFRFGSAGSGLGLVSSAGYFLLGRRGLAWIVMCHPVELGVDLPDSVAGCDESGGVREGLADAAACVGDLAACVLDVGQRLSLACL
jgi:hypothetical protein